MALLSNYSKKLILKGILIKNIRTNYRLVSTTNNNKTEDSGKDCQLNPGLYRKVPDFSNPQENKNWISYGWAEDDKAEDRFQAHFSFFLLVSVLMCGGIFLLIYLPDKSRKDWCHREAFIRLHEREQLGLDPIDKNYVDPSKIILPPDEELSEEEIVI